MLENITRFLKKFAKKQDSAAGSKDTAKERLHLVLMQDRANVSADFLDLMRQEIIDVIKKYIEVDEEAIDVRLTNQENADGTNGAPALYANIPIVNIREDAKKTEKNKEPKIEKKEDKQINEQESENKQSSEEEGIDSSLESIISNDKNTEEENKPSEQNEVMQQDKEETEKKSGLIEE